MMSISIALATYNGERFLKEQLASLAALDYPPAEVVVCDDGSTDSTLEILTAFAREAPFHVRIVENHSNLGWRENFLKAADLCKSDLVAFCDQDDVWYPHKLRVVAPLFSDPDLLLVHHEADLIDEAGVVYGKLRTGERDKARLERLSKPTTWSHASGLTMVFRRTLLAFRPYWPNSVDPGKPDRPAAHDQWVYHLASNLGEIRFISEPLVGYRQHAGNQVGYRLSRHHALSSPKSLKNEIGVHVKMLAGFREALQQAYAAGGTVFEARLPAAIEANRTLEQKLSLRFALFSEPNASDRLGLFLKLFKSGSYKLSTHWNLGRRSLLADIRAVLHQPR